MKTNILTYPDNVLYEIEKVRNRKLHLNREKSTFEYERNCYIRAIVIDNFDHRFSYICSHFDINKLKVKVFLMYFKEGETLKDIQDKLNINVSLIGRILSEMITKLAYKYFDYLIVEPSFIDGLMEKEQQYQDNLQKAFDEYYTKKFKVDEESYVKKLNDGIEILDLSVRSYNCLRRNQIRTIDQLVRLNKDDLKQVRNLGVRSIKEIKDKLWEQLKIKKDW